MRARFIGDPMERESDFPLSRPAGEWFEVVDPAHFAKLSANDHYEVEGVTIIGTDKAKRAGRRKPTLEEPKPAPKIEHDGWEDDEA